MQLLFERIGQVKRSEPFYRFVCASSCSKQSQREFTYTVSLSMLEIYNESIRDLLALPADRGSVSCVLASVCISSYSLARQIA
jgi:hypothetical protein